VARIPTRLHNSPVEVVATGTLDGFPVAVSGSRDGRVVLWHTSADDERRFAVEERFLQFPAAVHGLAIAPDNRLVVAFAHDIATYRLEDATPLPE